MAGWQQELADLLQELGVVPEYPQTDLRTNGISYFPGTFSASEEPHDEVSEAAEVSYFARHPEALGRELEEIVQEVIRLANCGELEEAAREDILEVLRALRTLSAVAHEVAPGDAAYFASVSATLHFCRLVLRLSETTIEGF
jgi:hypothetical protein